ncbi:hypothetical protein ACFQ1S_28590, partial [Kibdelosporangium lantanae]
MARFDKTATGEITGPRPQDFRGDRSFTVEAWVQHKWTAYDAAGILKAVGNDAGTTTNQLWPVDSPIYDKAMNGKYQT